LKVVHVIDQLNVGGAERICVGLVNNLSTRINDLQLVVLGSKGELSHLINSKVKVSYLDKNPLYKSIIELRKLIGPGDILHVHMRHVFKYAAIASFGLGCKVILHDHSSNTKFNISLFFLKYITVPKYYIGVSNSQLSWIRSYLRKLKFSTLLENTIFPNQLKINPSEVKTDRFVCVGNIKPLKNQMFGLKLIEASNYRIDFIGKIQDAEYYQEMQNFIKTNNLEDRVQFFHDYTTTEGVLNRYLLGLSFSKYESGPLVLIEYMNHDLPFVSFATGSVFERIGAKHDNLFLNNWDLNNWKNSIELNSKLSKNLCKGIYNQYYNTNNYIEECLSIYSKVNS
jgi:glycosyltransferase involved in cell wall biosynthesis